MTAEIRPRFVLASASPRRLALLEQLGLAPDQVWPAELDETPRKGETPRLYATRVAIEKAKAAAIAHRGAVCLGADTVVACGRRILPKAETEAQARTCLAVLSGRAHQVLTAVAVVIDDVVRQRVSLSRVAFRRLSSADIDGYIASEEWRGKAGGYAIQGRAGAWVRQLNGSYSGVVGLPLFETAALLSAAGVIVR